MEDDDPKSVEIMLGYLYTGQYNKSLDENEELRRQLLIQALTYNLADKYDIPALMELAKKRFKATLSRTPTLGEYLSIVSDVYTMPAPTNNLRAITSEYARLKLREMMQGSENHEDLRAALEDVPDFAFDVLQLFIKDPLRGRCSSCGPNIGAEALQARCKSCGKGGISL